MKRIFLVVLMVVFSANIALARGLDSHRPSHNNKRPVVVHQVAPQKKPHRDTVLAVGAISGLFGFAIGSQVNNSSSNVQIIDNSPRYYEETYYRPSQARCETTIYGYGHNQKKVTRCYNQPQVREIVYF